MKKNISKWLALLAVVAMLCGTPFKMGTMLFKGGRYANYLVFDEDTAGKHTIEITCNSGTLYLGGLFVS